MSPDKQMKSGNPRQKLMIIATVIVLLIVGYNVLGMLGGGGSVPEVPVVKPVAGAQAAPGAVPAAAPAPIFAAPKQTVIQPNPDISRIQSQTQAEYLNDLNNLQLLKVQKDIAEMKQAIAAAKLATITTETNIADSLMAKTQPVAAPLPAPQSEIASGALPPAPPPAPVAAPAPPPAPTVNYTVMSVSFQGKRWNAILKADAKLINVMVGDKLKDGSTVVDIDKDGVVLKKEDKKIRISLSNSI